MNKGRWLQRNRFLVVIGAYLLFFRRPVGDKFHGLMADSFHQMWEYLGLPFEDIKLLPRAEVKL